MSERDDKQAQEIVGKWGYEEPYWWEPIAAALADREREVWDAAIALLADLSVVIGRRGVRKGSDLNGWYSAINEATKAFEAARAAQENEKER